MRVVLCQTKNGLPSALAFFMKATDCPTSTSSNVVMSYLAPPVVSPSPPYIVRPVFGPGPSGVERSDRPRRSRRCEPDCAVGPYPGWRGLGDMNTSTDRT